MFLRLHIFNQIHLFLIVKCAVSTPAYFAEKLYKSMKVLKKNKINNSCSTLIFVLKIGQCFILFVNLQGAGTDETTLTRVMVSRGEIDMLDIRVEYKKLYQSSLYKEINVS